MPQTKRKVFQCFGERNGRCRALLPMLQWEICYVFTACSGGEKLDEGMLGGIAFVGTARNVQVLGNSDGGMV